MIKQEGYYLFASFFFFFVLRKTFFFTFEHIHYVLFNLFDSSLSDSPYPTHAFTHMSETESDIFQQALLPISHC